MRRQHRHPPLVNGRLKLNYKKRFSVSRLRRFTVETLRLSSGCTVTWDWVTLKRNIHISVTSTLCKAMERGLTTVLWCTFKTMIASVVASMDFIEVDLLGILLRRPLAVSSDISKGFYRVRHASLLNKLFKWASTDLCNWIFNRSIPVVYIWSMEKVWILGTIKSIWSFTLVARIVRLRRLS